MYYVVVEVIINSILFITKSNISDWETHEICHQTFLCVSPPFTYILTFHSVHAVLSCTAYIVYLLHAHIYTNTHTYIHTHTLTYIHKHTYIHTYKHTFKHTHSRIYSHIYTNTHSLTHTHSHYHLHILTIDT